jgi:hypothetical protein
VLSSTVGWGGNGLWLVFCPGSIFSIHKADDKQWWCAIGIGIAFVFCLLFMEETNYDRRTTTSALSSSQASLEVAGETDLSASEKNTAKNGVQVSDPTFSHDKKIPEDQHSTDVAAAELGQVAYPRKTYWQKLSVIDKKRPNRMLDIMWAPFKFFTFPVVVWAGFMYGLQGLVYPGILNATASVIYTNSYYHFSSDAVGFAYFAAVAGMVLGSLWVTLAGPQLVIRLARRRGGISEPEDILWLFMASASLCRWRWSCGESAPNTGYIGSGWSLLKLASPYPVHSACRQQFNMQPVHIGT